MDTPLLFEDRVSRMHDELLRQLKSGQLPPGARLPTERQLCEQFGVGRSALRRVLRALKEQGLIVQRVGSGTYVAESSSGLLNTGLNVADISPAQIMEARILLEPVMLDLVVTNATAQDLAKLDECCLKAEQAESLEAFEHWDGALHQQLAEATHNVFFVQFFRMVTQARENSEWGVLKKKSVSPERRVRYQQEHRALVNALKQRDAQEARRILSEHLINIRKNLLGS